MLKQLFALVITLIAAAIFAYYIKPNGFWFRTGFAVVTAS